MCFSYNWRYQDFDLVINLKPLLLFIRKWSITTCSESLHWMMNARPQGRWFTVDASRFHSRQLEVNDHQWPAMTPYGWYHERYSALVLVVSRSCMSQRKASAVGKDAWLLIHLVIFFSLSCILAFFLFLDHDLRLPPGMLRKKTVTYKIQSSPCSVMVDSSSRKAAQQWCGWQVAVKLWTMDLIGESVRSHVAQLVNWGACVCAALTLPALNCPPPKDNGRYGDEVKSDVAKNYNRNIGIRITTF